MRLRLLLKPDMRKGFVVAAVAAAVYIAGSAARNYFHPNTISGVPAGILLGASVCVLASIIIGFAVVLRRRGR